MHTSDFVHDFGIVIVGAALSMVITRRLNLSPVLGFLVAGAILGPFSLFGTQISDVETVRLLADVGLVMLLFALGVELGWQRIRSVGPGVLVIGTIELAVMIALGLGAGSFLGWSPIESLFLGAAIAVSSSAVLVQMLRDRGELMSERGRLIIGILVVEDFAAVVLLSVLAGVATQGSAGEAEAFAISWRLLVFGVAALVFGALLVPRLMDLIARTNSNQVVIMGALGMCFGLAIAAGQLGLSAGAGAFIIGTVIGDTRHSETVSRMTEPVRDLFAAIFFVSIGMLVDLAEVARFILPVLFITSVVIAGKVFANSAATYLSGRSGRTSLEVGTAMAQPGEFSLAMVKTGTDHGAVNSALSPIVTAVIVVSSVFYPFVSGSARVLEAVISRRSPDLLRRRAIAINSSRGFAIPVIRPESPAGVVIRRQLSIALVNMGVIGLVVVGGVVVLDFVGPIAGALSVSHDAAGIVLGGVLVTLSVPPGMMVWKSLSLITEELAYEIAFRRVYASRDAFVIAAFSLASHGFFALLLVVVAVWMTPALWKLVSVGSLTSPVAVLAMIGAMSLAARVAIKFHSSLEDAFEHIFLGPADEVREQPEQFESSGAAPEPATAEPVPVPKRRVQSPAPGASISGVAWQRSSISDQHGLRR